MKRLADYLPVSMAILLATVLTAALHAAGAGILTSALLGSASAVLSVWLAFFSIYRFIMFVTRGAPFRIGDGVQVTAGDHTGKEGEVTKLVDGYPAVFLKLEGEGSGGDERYFDWNQVTRRGVSKSGRTRRGTTTA